MPQAHLPIILFAANGKIDSFISAVYDYPTLSDLYKYAAYDGLGSLAAWAQPA